jgi:methylamine dehydrogenase accessory protein MauD
MSIFWIVSMVILWALVLFFGFLLLGTLRSLGLLSWRLEQLEATTPRRLGRDGLKPGKKAPDFTLASATGPEMSLHDLAGRKVLVVFVQGGCSPCHLVVPELNRLRHKGEAAVLAIFNGDPEAARKWTAEVKAEFPVLSQEKLAVSKRYQVFATPFAFLVDERGIIASKGIINNAQHIGYVLAGRGAGVKDEHAEPEGAEQTGVDESRSSHSVKEVSHV